MKRSSAPNAPPLPGSRHALFIDFDGTLGAAANESAERTAAPEMVIGLLTGLERRFGGALAVMTSERLETLDQKLTPLKLCGAGLHGAQLRLTAGEAITTEARPLTGLFERLRARFAQEPAVVLEDRGAVIVIHGTEQAGHPAEVRRELTEVAHEHRLELLPARGSYHLMGRGQGKDLAVRQLMRHPPFQHRLPVFVGDSPTDEAGIREAQTLGGLGIKVGPGDTVAEWRLDDPAAVMAWLRNALWSLPDN